EKDIAEVIKARPLHARARGADCAPTWLEHEFWLIGRERSDVNERFECLQGEAVDEVSVLVALPFHERVFDHEQVRTVAAEPVAAEALDLGRPLVGRKPDLPEAVQGVQVGLRRACFGPQAPLALLCTAELQTRLLRRSPAVLPRLLRR